MKELRVRLQHRYNEKDVWFRVNPILEAGEMGIESDTGRFKYGDGKHKWRELDYAYGSGLTSVFANSADDLKNNYPAEDYPGAIAIVPIEYENAPVIGSDGKPTGETESFIMDTPYISLRKNNIYYWTVFSDQKNKPIASSALDFFQLDISILG